MDMDMQHGLELSAWTWISNMDMDMVALEWTCSRDIDTQDAMK
jgi:hypothetical protein